MTTDPILCEDCQTKWSNGIDLVIETRWVYNVHKGGNYSYCIHKFREIKFTETNLELLERRYEENLNK